MHIINIAFKFINSGDFLVEMKWNICLLQQELIETLLDIWCVDDGTVLKVGQIELLEICKSG